MTKNRLIARTATLALIATLAAPAIAQDIAPAPAPVEPVQAPTAPSAPSVIVRQAAPAPAQTTIAPPVATPTAQATPTNRVAPEAAAQVEAEQAAAREAAAQARQAAARRAAPVAPASAEPASQTVAETPATAPAAQAPIVDQTAEVAPPVAAEPAPPADIAPATTTDAEPSTNWTPWIVGVAGIGAAFALLAWAATRRRRNAPRRETVNLEIARPVEPRPMPVKTPAMPATRTQPTAPQPAVSEPAMAMTAAPMVAHGASSTTSPHREQMVDNMHEGMGRHERAALAGPTADNPFLTRRARLKRARFYDQRERMAVEEGRAKPPVQQPATAPVTRAQNPAREVERPRTVKPVGWPGGFKPAFGQG
jgi:hypothetical protein